MVVVRVSVRSGHVRSAERRRGGAAAAAPRRLRRGYDPGSAMATDKPITFAEHVQLTDLGIAPESITFANVTLESEKFVCVRESGASGNSVTIVDLNNIQHVYVAGAAAPAHRAGFGGQ